MARRPTTLVQGVLAIAAVLATAACSAATVRDKTGARTIVLRFATIDTLNPNGQSVAPTAFVDALTARSHDRLKVVVQQHYQNGAADAESHLIRAIGTGTLDGGWPSSRSFAAAGIHGLEPLEAPFVLVNHRSDAAVTTGAAAQTVLKALDDTDVVGLGLAAGPLRRPFADHPVLSRSDWTGLTIRSYNSPEQDAVYRALGAVPVEASYHFPQLVASGRLHAAETDIAQYLTNSYARLLPYVTRNVVLWPKTFVFCVASKTWARLDDQERSWLREAAADAARSAATYRYDETTAAAALCRSGVRFLDASPAQLAALHRAVEPVIARLESDPVTKPAMEVAAAAARQHPGADVPQVPAICQQLPDHARRSGS
jgi:TRAP-type C4-dicarboxylate transport system substrate-binding protein